MYVITHKACIAYIHALIRATAHTEILAIDELLKFTLTLFPNGSPVKSV